MIQIETAVLRRMRHHDTEAVRAIDAAAYSRPWSVQTWRHELVDPERHHVVATRAGEVIGHAGMLLIVGEAHLTTVAVSLDCQGSGVATALVLELLDEAVAKGCDAATLEVRASDRRAQRMYSRIGFAPAGIRPRYYTDPDDDAVIMWLADLGEVLTAERLEALRSALGRSVADD